MANIAVVAAGRNCGIGHAKLQSFFGGLNIPGPMHFTTYESITKEVHAASKASQAKSFADAAQCIRKFYMDQDPTIDRNDVLDICVSFDGTWHKRGHSSHHGVGVVIEVNTGLVIDTQVMSNFCAGCRTAPDEKDPDYSTWKEFHECQQNHEGSANSMEVSSALVLFKRSIALHNFRYTSIVCDGDAKTVAMLNNTKVYGDTEIKKEDCVNHVAKRMFKGIEVLILMNFWFSFYSRFFHQTLRKKLSGTKNSISGNGKGKVTAKVQAKLSGYYANQLKINAPGRSYIIIVYVIFADSLMDLQMLRRCGLALWQLCCTWVQQMSTLNITCARLERRAGATISELQVLEKPRDPTAVR